MALDTKQRENIIRNYIDGYNNFNIDQMIYDFDTAIVFENINDGVITMSLNGLSSFREQAEEALKYFTSRTQTVKSINHLDAVSEVEIEYDAIVAEDLPNGLKKGDTITLSGKSVFEFKNNRIARLTDIS